MADYHPTLEIFYQSWKEYMDTVKGALAPLTAEQLELRASPNERSVGEIASHIVRARVGWFHDFMGEGGEEIAPYMQGDAPWATAGAAGLVEALNRSWEFMADCLARWSSEDMQFTFPNEWRGDHYDLPRSWVVWHVLEHDLIHGGEISLTLGMHGLDAPRP